MRNDHEVIIVDNYRDGHHHKMPIIAITKQSHMCAVETARVNTLRADIAITAAYIDRPPLTAASPLV